MEQPSGALPDVREHRTLGIVPVLAFAGITVAVMQTLSCRSSRTCRNS
jgi:hypothetical protein